MNPTLIIFLVVDALVIALIVAIFIIRRKKKQQIDVSLFSEALPKNDIESIDYLRNKINITLRTLDNLNTDELVQLGAKKISIVGNKVKFYISEDNTKNEAFYNALNDWLER